MHRTAKGMDKKLWNELEPAIHSYAGVWRQGHRVRSKVSGFFTKFPAWLPAFERAKEQPRTPTTRGRRILARGGAAA